MQVRRLWARVEPCLVHRDRGVVLDRDPLRRDIRSSVRLNVTSGTTQKEPT